MLLLAAETAYNDFPRVMFLLVRDRFAPRPYPADRRVHRIAPTPSGPDLTLTVIVPDLAVRHWWQRPLHENTAIRLRHALAPLSKVVVTSVPLHV